MLYIERHTYWIVEGLVRATPQFVSLEFNDIGTRVVIPDPADENPLVPLVHIPSIRAWSRTVARTVLAMAQERGIASAASELNVPSSS